MTLCIRQVEFYAQRRADKESLKPALASRPLMGNHMGGMEGSGLRRLSVRDYGVI